MGCAVYLEIAGTITARFQLVGLAYPPRNREHISGFMAQEMELCRTVDMADEHLDIKRCKIDQQRAL